jgi:hypothetical protein
MRFEGLPKGAKGYRAASEQIGSEIRRLWEEARELNQRRLA